MKFHFYRFGWATPRTFDSDSIDGQMKLYYETLKTRPIPTTDNYFDVGEDLANAVGSVMVYITPEAASKTGGICLWPIIYPHIIASVGQRMTTTCGLTFMVRYSRYMRPFSMMIIRDKDYYRCVKLAAKKLKSFFPPAIDARWEAIQIGRSCIQEHMGEMKRLFQDDPCDLDGVARRDLLCCSWCETKLETAEGSPMIPIRMHDVKRCARCERAAYCSKKCQIKHWRNGHKGVCVEVHKQALSPQALRSLGQGTIYMKNASYVRHTLIIIHCLYLMGVFEEQEAVGDFLFEAAKAHNCRNPTPKLLTV